MNNIEYRELESGIKNNQKLKVKYTIYILAVLTELREIVKKQM